MAYTKRFRHSENIENSLIMKEGDKVKLKDSHTIMIVTGIDDDYVSCTWINKLDAEMKGSFPKHLLTIDT